MILIFKKIKNEQFCLDDKSKMLIHNNMEVYRCEKCEYFTEKKYNFLRHLMSKKHFKKNMQKTTAPKNVQSAPKKVQFALFSVQNKKKNEQFKQNKDEKRFECKFCKKKFSRRTCLNRHNKICKHLKENEIKDTIKKLEEKIEKNTEQIDEKTKQIEEKDKIIGILENTTIKTINISNRITKYLENNYKNVPAIMPPSGETVKMIIGVKNDIGNYFTLEKKELIKVIREIIINIYKEEKNIFSTDVSRLSFYINIKEIIEKNKKELKKWIQDPKGVKIKEIVIKPLVNYMKEELQKQNIILLAKIENEFDINKLNEFLDRMKKTTDAIITIMNDDFADDIIKEIAPYFKFNEKTEK